MTSNQTKDSRTTHLTKERLNGILPLNAMKNESNRINNLIILDIRHAKSITNLSQLCQRYEIAIAFGNRIPILFNGYYKEQQQNKQKF